MLMKPALLALAATVALAAPASASIIRVQQSAFTAAAGLITFSEFAGGTSNPTYAPATYGGGAGAPTVTFGGFFTGQALGNAGTCPAGAALTGCVVGSPTGPLSLDPSSPATFIADDGAQTNSPILSGNPLYNGPIAIKFSVPQVGVGLDGGYFNAVASTAITAFDANGNVIGQVANTQEGVEFLGLVTSDNSATISGLLFSLVGDEPAGFDVDSIRFGVAGQVINPGNPVPEPATAALLMTGVAGIGLMRRRAPRAS